VIAQTHGVDMDSAFTSLRDYSRSDNLNLRDVAQRVAARKVLI